MFAYRELKREDAKNICGFPQSEEELFHMFPRATYPLVPDVLLKEAENRFSPIVALMDDETAGYGNFIEANEGNYCVIGNLIVNPAFRNMGAASFLVSTLSDIALKSYGAGHVKLSCFNSNTAGLLLYKKIGFAPVDLVERKAPNGQRVALIHMQKALPGR